MITLERLTKRFGARTAVDDLSAEITAGSVTGFLGPNGAGKSTTMRMILGLDRPTSGRALIGGRPYQELRYPLREVGALLDAKALHPGRRARTHLRALARSHGIPAARVDDVLEMVGLGGVERQRAGTFSLGMSQRLGIAAALIGDPGILLFDEPVNGLDPDGVLWIRTLIRSLAAEGRTVFVSSHLMSEMELMADQLVVIGRGRLIAHAPVAEVIAASSQAAVVVRGPDHERITGLGRHLAAAGARVESEEEGRLLVSGAPIEDVGLAAHRLGVPLFELSSRRASLEQAYMELTADSAQFTAS
ncbi:ATP-binding cassette domain-containing protein [Streptomyces hoynatensis]|uniref:ATP-binding cassette domain-containing protein n=1 Tax=Streptomyces hoynatensis TaxID=1141874 RepID=A0A3A9Z119_9ACTN|nr:ATP-binding cassette domain-containing protein [Streptomyces hoynatensis]RKN41644.1 ATP-binding cassette domain-containing protein [Streptomyces hoynatensis]